MSTFKTTDTVGDIVTRSPALARVFEHASIDYCCGGKKTLEEVCQKKGIDSSALLATLESTLSSGEKDDTVDTAALSLSELADHIEQTHHSYLRSEFPRLDEITKKVASVHGEKDSRLYQIRDTFQTLVEELTSHIMKEEHIFFPMVRQLEASNEAPTFYCGSIAGPIGQMEAEHDQAGSALERLRELTDNFTPPERACNTYRVLLDTLNHLERDLHMHIHKENKDVTCMNWYVHLLT